MPKPSPLHNSRKRPLLCSQLSLDEREEKLQSVLTESKHVIEDLFNIANQGLIITNSASYILQINSVLYRMGGYAEEELLGKHISILLVGNDPPGTYPSRMKCLLEKGIVEKCEAAYKRKDGISMPVEIYSVSIRNRQGSLLGYFVMVKDITDRKKYERDLQHTHNFLEDIFDNSGEGIVITGEKGNIIKVNKTMEQLLGYSEDDLIGKHMSSLLIDHEIEKEAKGMMDEVRKNGFVEGWKLVCSRRDGRSCHVELNMNLLRDEMEKVKGSVVTVRDITRLVKAEEELKKNEGDLKQKISELAELNTALKVLLQKSYEEKRDLQEYMVRKVQKLLEPHLDRFKKANNPVSQRRYLETIDSSLEEIIAPFFRSLSFKTANLTPAESRVARYIKEDRSTKEIAHLLSVSINTVESHRKSLRKKLGLQNRSVNLKSYLSSF